MNLLRCPKCLSREFQIRVGSVNLRVTCNSCGAVIVVEVSLSELVFLQDLAS